MIIVFFYFLCLLQIILSQLFYYQNTAFNVLQYVPSAVQSSASCPLSLSLSVRPVIGQLVKYWALIG